LTKLIIKNLAKMYLERNENFEKFRKINISTIFSYIENEKIVNEYVPKIMMFVVFTAKLLEIFLVPNFNFVSSKCYITVFFKKLNHYPLFFNKKYGINSPTMALKYLHSDFVKILKHLGVHIIDEICMLDNLEDISALVDLVHDEYLQKK